MNSFANIAVSGMRAASLGLQAAAHNVANLGNPAASRQTIGQQASPDGGVRAGIVAAAAEPAAPVTDLVDAMAYRLQFDAGAFVLKVADDTLGSLLDVSA